MLLRRKHYFNVTFSLKKNAFVKIVKVHMCLYSNFTKYR